MSPVVPTLLESIRMQAIFAQFMNGVSHMLVFVVAGGVLTAVSFSWGFTSFDSTAADYNSFAALLKIIGGICMAMMLYPVCSSVVVGLVMLTISGPMATINTAMMDFLHSLSAAGPVVLGLAIGCMCAFDMGGPVNKAAYVTGTLMLTETAIPFMTKNIWPVMPIMMLGSSIGAILTIFFGVHDPAPMAASLCWCGFICLKCRFSIERMS